MAGFSAGSGLAYTPPTSGGYVRPSDWPVLPSPPSDAVSMLCAVFSNSGNNVALNITVVGGYTVNWGDGTIDNWASGVQAEHTYNYATLGTPVTSRGYKTAIIQIYAQTPGSAVTAFSFAAKSSVFGTQSNGAMQWLDITVNTPSATSLSFSAAGKTSSFLEITTILACGPATTLTYVWQQCFNLQSCVLPAGFGSAATNMSGLWTQCNSLVNLILPTGFGSSALTLDAMFSSCSALRNIIFPSGFGAVATSAYGVFTACNSLEYVAFPAGSGSHITTIESIFFQCSSLLSAIFPTGFGAALTNVNNSFNGCSSLRDITFTTTIGPLITLMTTPFANCPNLESIVGMALPLTFSVGGSKFSAANLNALYTALPTVTTQTLTASTNYGYAASTPTIATAKGWTVA